MPRPLRKGEKDPATGKTKAQTKRQENMDKLNSPTLDPAKDLPSNKDNS